jgi:hypothetical protein
LSVRSVSVPEQLTSPAGQLTLTLTVPSELTVREVPLTDTPRDTASSSRFVLAAASSSRFVLAAASSCCFWLAALCSEGGGEMTVSVRVGVVNVDGPAQSLGVSVKDAAQ